VLSLSINSAFFSSSTSCNSSKGMQGRACTHTSYA
jgi:hypothetical protein